MFWICKEIPSDALLNVCVFVCQELECLQDHLDDLVPNCRDVVGNLTELESEVKKNAFVIFTAVWLWN